MKKITIVLLTLLFGASGYAQISYTYDAAGNRERREVSLKSAEIKQDSVLASQSVVIDEQMQSVELNPALVEEFGEIEAKLYPNPTKGAVYIELNHLPEGERPRLEIWSLDGKLMEQAKISSPVTRINLWGKPNGMYLIKTVLNGQPVTWKIIKE